MPATPAIQALTEAPTDDPTAMEMQKNFAANLRLLCGFYPSVSHVCRDLGINRAQFNRYLAASARPSTHVLNRLCDYFGVEATEIHLEPGHFSRLVSVRRRPQGPTRDYAETVDALHARCRPEMRKYLGFYFEYYYSMSAPGKILRGIVHFFESGNAVYFRRVEHFRHIGAGRGKFKCRYTGAAFFLEDRIFMVDTETLTGNEITETILFPSWRNKVSHLTGLVMGVSSGDHRRIACARILLEWLGTSVDLRRAIGSCGLFDPDSNDIDVNIRVLIDNNQPGDSPLFYARNA